MRFGEFQELEQTGWDELLFEGRIDFLPQTGLLPDRICCEKWCDLPLAWFVDFAIGDMQSSFNRSLIQAKTLARLQKIEQNTSLQYLEAFLRNVPQSCKVPSIVSTRLDARLSSRKGQ